MKSLKMVMIAIAAFAVVALAGCSGSIKVPDMSVLRVEVPRISTRNYAVAEQFCRWQSYTTKGTRFFKSQQECVSLLRDGSVLVPISLMRWKRPTEYDTDRCSLKSKLSERCKKVVKIFFMREHFMIGGENKNMYGGNIVATDKTLRLDVRAREHLASQAFSTTTIGVKSVLAWARKMNKLAASAPPANNPG